MVVPSRHQSACGIQSVVGYHPEDGRSILVYRLAMDARTRKGDDDGAGCKYPSLLEDFQTGTASMAR